MSTTFEMMVAIRHAVDHPTHTGGDDGTDTPFAVVHRQIMQYMQTLQHIEPT